MNRAGDDAAGAPPACGGRSDEVGARPPKWVGSPLR
jgi:hypothetical protein